MPLFDVENPQDVHHGDQHVYSVSQITREIKWVLEDTFPSLWVEGEVSNFKRHTSGHLYFSLKDSDAQIPCVMWRGRNQGLLFNPGDGMKVIAMGQLSLYEKHGRYQLDVMRMLPRGAGELNLAFEALKRKLEAEGLFAAKSKKPLPQFPETIGIVTSPTGAAVRDIVSILRRRQPGIQIILYPVKVQGVGAAEEIAEAIRRFNRYGAIDVLIVSRGGGSIEDLWAFNEETAARAIYESDIPVISAVGHEIDFTICDFTADMRAPTPSAAAEIAVRDRYELQQQLLSYKDRMEERIRFSVQRFREQLAGLKRSYGFHTPSDRLKESAMRLDDLYGQLKRSIQSHVERRESLMQHMEARLKSLDPQAVLARGYSITMKEDRTVVTDASGLSEGGRVITRFHKGSATSTIDVIERI